MRIFLSLIIAIIAAHTPSWAMEHYTNTVKDQFGKVIGGASVTVYKTGTSTLATIYSDNGITAKANPFVTNVYSGVVDFYAENGAYDLVFSAAGKTFTANDTKRITLFDYNDLAVSTFPSSPYTGQLVVMIVDSVSGACDGAGIDGVTLCIWDGSVWRAVVGGGGGIGAESDTLQTVFSRGKIITGADSEANAAQFGSASKGLKLFDDPTKGLMIKPSTLGDSAWRCWTNFNCIIRDEEADATVLMIDPDAANVHDMYVFGTNYRPYKSIWFGAGSLDGDGTNCPALATTVTINSGPKIPTFICADSSSSILYGAVKMPGDWDGGAIYISHVVIQTAADTNAVNGDVSAQCRGAGVAVNSTWGTSQAIDFSVTGSNKNDYSQSAAVTPNGTCAVGDMLYFRYVLDATGTTTATATLHHVGFRLAYKITGLSH